MRCVSADRQGESESRSEWIYLFLCDYLCTCVAESDAGGGRNGGRRWWKGKAARASMFTHLFCVFCPISPVSFRSSRKFLHLWFPAPLFRPCPPWLSEVKEKKKQKNTSYLISLSVSFVFFSLPSFQWCNIIAIWRKSELWNRSVKGATCSFWNTVLISMERFFFVMPK